MSGNKGAVGIRLEYHDTSFCFLTAHLAAGHSNVEERNADYRTIASGLHFQKGKNISSHEYAFVSSSLNFVWFFPSNVIWLGDVNYRLDLDNETARASVEADAFDALLAADQVFNNSSALHVDINQE